MKIVINDKFGGFSLSHQGVMRYAEIKGIKLYPYIDDISKKVYPDKATLDNPSILIHYVTVPTNEYEKVHAKDKGNRNYSKSNELHFSAGDIERNDPFLIQVVEELKDKANGQCAQLKIIEIPDDIEWEIEEYDGLEHIAEKHRTWQ